MTANELSADTITRNLNTRCIGQRVLYFPSTTSTNEIAHREARQGAEEGTVIVAGEQVAGRGRLHRTWSSPRGTLALSVIFRPRTEQLHSLIMVASLAVLHTIRKVSRLEPQIKWPNDVLINGKKVCGILIENGWQGTRLDYAVVGIGINVNFRPADYPEIAATATSLSGELGRETPLVDVVRQLLVKLDRLYPATTAVFKEWQANLATLGKPVKVTSGETAYEGVATSVDRDGGLVIRLPDGTSQRVEAGDVTLRGS